MSVRTVSINVAGIGRTIIRRAKPGLESLLFVVLVIFATGVVASAQLTDLEQGLTDPVGAPAFYTTLRSDDLMIGQLTHQGNEEINQVTSYQVDSQDRLSTQISVA